MQWGLGRESKAPQDRTSGGWMRGSAREGRECPRFQRPPAEDGASQEAGGGEPGATGHCM
ncbi:hypothetical protein E2562_018139 [Oryza meyeriana var. granulata]|uniref:Uncharacterized protein n=1 Tax=Oryza meyeriana var. granulata TaxID=110450 RepID=A0A6G1C5R6_9ORYZ|nr:hypothetical protein E2562_018139 [Oryza meyeriana var. granulata]